MKKKSSVKVSILLAIAVFIMSFQGLTFEVFAAEKSEPTLIENAGNAENIVRFGANYGSMITTGISGAPTADVVGADCTNSESKIGNFGIRNNTNGQFSVSAANSYIVVSYYIMAQGGTHSIPAAIQDTSGNSNIYADGNFLKSETVLKENVWYKAIQIFKIETAGNNNLRFVVSAGNYGQKTYVGGVKVCNFGTDYTLDEIKTYVSDAGLKSITNGGAVIDGFDKNTYNYTVDTSLGVGAAANALCDVSYDNSNAGKTVIVTKAYTAGVLNTEPADTRTYTVSVKEPYTSMFAETYDSGAWTMADVKHRGNSRPKIENDGEKEFAMKFYGNDANYTESEKGKSIFRGQLSSSYLVNSNNLTTGDKVYISFYARAYSKYGNECKIQPALQSEKSGGGLSTSYSGDVFTLSDVWKKYSTVITLDKVQADGTEGTRITLALGYHGQVTYISDFEIYRCDASFSDSEIKALFDNDIENLLSSNKMSKGGSVTVAEQAVSDNNVPFSTEYVYTENGAYSDTEKSVIGKYSARNANILNDLVNTGDVLLLTYWAKGDMDNSKLSTGDISTAMISPLIQSTQSGGPIVYSIGNDGIENKTGDEITSNWKRYAYIFKIPSESAYRIQLQIGLKGQTTHIADVMLYNLGNIAVSDAYAISQNKDILGASYNTKAMQITGDTYTAKLAKDEIFDISKVSAYAKYPFISTKISDGKITLTAANGDEISYNIKSENAKKEIFADAVNYYAMSAKNAIFRLDDLRPETIADFGYAAEYLHSKGITAAFGIIGTDWENASENDWNTIKKWQDEYGIELFCHGYYHTEQEYSTASYTEQYDSLNKYLTLLNTHGIVTKTFGSPFNNSTVVTSKALNALGFENNMFGIKNTAENQMNFSDRCNIEAKTGVASFDEFKKNIGNFENAECIVIQGHTANWDTDSRTAFENTVGYLLENNYNITTPAAYNAAVNAKNKISAPKTGDITAEVNLCSGSLDTKSATLILAVYDNSGALTDTVIKTVSLDSKDENTFSLTSNIPSEGCRVKVFVWNGINSIFPIQKADILE